MTRFIIAIVTLGVMGCSDKRPAPEPEQAQPEQAPASATAAQEARELFNTLCSTCHGTSGQGDGVAAASLQVKPRNYTDKAWQASVTDDQLKQVILGGGSAVGKSPLMPAQPQLASKPEVVDELIKIVRSFGN